MNNVQTDISGLWSRCNMVRLWVPPDKEENKIDQLVKMVTEDTSLWEYISNEILSLASETEPTERERELIKGIENALVSNVVRQEH
jgi:hypothetical protein